MTTRIDAERLWATHMELAQIGATANDGVCRLAASPEDGAGRDRFAAWCREAGLDMRVDRIGNMFARRRGRRDDLPPVLVGSHLDSQPTGGKFDGAFGVLAGLEIVRQLNAREMDTDHPVELVNWTNEEGCRFQPSSLGAEVFAGLLLLEEGLSRHDADGKRLEDELRAIGYLGEAPVRGTLPKAYLEGHIEQGPILEETRCQVGIVEGSMGVNAYEVELTGVEAHTGTTPVGRRKDALLAACRIASAVNELAFRYEPDGRATVAQMQISPNVRSVVASRVTLTTDCRHADPDMLERMTEELNYILRREAERHDVGMTSRLYWSNPALRFDETCVAALRRAAENGGFSSQPLVSGAGHDAIPIARVVPAAMLFVPSKDGVSHNEAEYTSPDELAVGCAVLMEAVLQLAQA
ncbi:Zn-dependent hydrolase [uncultured Enterovirga sp.]|uniref:Zn-dependent hydrolase n=1 Tax=uncultured Enterovirga sp. TaxID=2026352 RepID=UPI0035CA4187